jgi:hypothetical protein
MGGTASVPIFPHLSQLLNVREGLLSRLPDLENGSRLIYLPGDQHGGRKVWLVRRVRVVLGLECKTIALPIFAVAGS